MTQRAVFITGSSSGLGRAAARLFSARGWKVVATMRNPEGEHQPDGSDPHDEGVPQGHGAAILRRRNAGGSMTIELSGPVSAFFDAERTQDLEALGRCFSDRAIVRDEGRSVEGPDAIKRWMKEAKAKYHNTVEPLGVSHRDGLTVVTTRVAGAFPNSPLDIQHLFAVEGGKIVSLEIR